jgi:hypothetical protein
MDWSEAPLSDYKPGVYLGEVKKCETKIARSGESYLNLEWHDVSGAFGEGGLICWDRLMMGGRGRGISQAKLKVLGFRGTEPSIEPEDVVGRRAWIRVDWHEYEPNGEKKRNLQVTSQFRPEFQSGYWPENSPPKIEGGGALAPIEDDTPF